ncbi:MAG: hypothetical protein EZS28_032643 [Streblomastix strix]|uniref:Uncharacterized protein n=1 Tax=Streblomastix strix TaxID=222440 RepID=A0A5J4UN16_9EUKA|nr:MAG: hypothetical protein EZS28_032643 [Streblomastix strix]
MKENSKLRSLRDLISSGQKTFERLRIGAIAPQEKAEKCNQALIDLDQADILCRSTEIYGRGQELSEKTSKDLAALAVPCMRGYLLQYSPCETDQQLQRLEQAKQSYIMYLKICKDLRIGEDEELFLQLYKSVKSKQLTDSSQQLTFEEPKDI